MDVGKFLKFINVVFVMDLVVNIGALLANKFVLACVVGAYQILQIPWM